MAALLLCTPTAAAAACCDAQLINDAAVSFARNGFAVLPNFASQVEVNAMRSAMEGLVEAWWNEERAAPDHDRNVFTTGANQTSAQAKSNYFFTSADRVHFFREAVDEGDASSTQPRPHLNKVGHGLHLNASTPFGAYARSERVSAVARKVAGLVAPVLPQSMYIFKEARLGGAVTSHQDGTFLYTRPHQTVVGLWLALDAAHEGNGCLWARPGSHHEPLRRRFVRTLGEAGDVVMTFVNASAEQPEVYLSAQLRGGDATPAPTNASDATTEVKWWQRLLRWARRRLALLSRTKTATSSAANTLVLGKACGHPRIWRQEPSPDCRLPNCSVREASSLSTSKRVIWSSSPGRSTICLCPTDRRTRGTRSSCIWSRALPPASSGRAKTGFSTLGAVTS